MRITLINQFYVPDISPTAQLSGSLAEGLAALGHEVSVVASRGGYVAPVKGEALVGAAPGNVKVYRVWTPQLGKKDILRRCIDYGCFYLFAALRMVRLPAQDVIISLTTPPYIVWTGVFHKWRHPRAKLVLWNMDCYPELAEREHAIRPDGPLSRTMRALNRALFRQLDHLVSLDASMQRLLMEHYARPHAFPGASVIPNWERASDYPAPVASEREQGKRALAELEPALAGQFIVLYMGNAGVGHSFETVLEAAGRLRDRKVSFLFVGGGKRWMALQETKTRMGLDNVHLRPYVPKEQVRRLMSAGDCSLITLRDEILGVMSPSKLHASLAMGLPVIYVGPEESNVDEAIKRFACGQSVRHGDVEAFVRFIEILQNDPKAADAMRERARSAFETAYCDRATLPQFRRLVDSLAEGRAAPANVASPPGSGAAID